MAARFVAAGLLAAGLGALFIACGGGTSSGNPSPSPGQSPSPSQNPCPTSLLPSDSGRAALSGPPSPAVLGPQSEGPSGLQAAFDKNGDFRDGNPRWTLLDAQWLHRSAGARGVRPEALSAPAQASSDIGEIAVIQDEGDIVAQPNAFDLRKAGLRFAPNGSGGYDVSQIDAGFRSNIGDPVTLADDDFTERDVPFAFTFYGTTQSAAYVNSDGNITFGEGDRSSSERSVGRLLTGAPRVAPFLADLDPSAGGKVFIRSGSDAFTATWCGVKVFSSTRVVTMQASVLPDGTIEMKYADAPAWSGADGIVGLSPGHTGTFNTLDLDTVSNGTVAGGSGALGERFSLKPSLDLIGTARKFYATHADLYDQLVIFTDQTLTLDAFSFELPVANEVTGIGVDIFDDSHEFGSAGRLRSVVQMDDINKFPADPSVVVLDENSTLSVVGQEVGHRWLAFMRFTDVNHQPSDALLGRDKAHWSFFFNSDASVMEGNRIQDLGGGSFKTTGAVEKYSPLDQYAMGLIHDFEVPPMFYVEGPSNVVPFERPESAPKIGVTFNGTRRDVVINDVEDVMGPRRPPPEQSARVHRQAFLFVVTKGRTLNPDDVAKVERIRSAWIPFFNKATDGRMTAETRLHPIT